LGSQLELVGGEGEFWPTHLSGTRHDFYVVITEPARIEAQLFYFPGWRLHVDGAERPIEISRPHGLITFPLEPGEHQVELRFGATPLRRMASLWSWVALAGLAVSIVTLRPKSG
jgi:hypothetical protein